MNGSQIRWSGAARLEATSILASPAGMIVAPTKVGYIVMATDRVGLDRKFEAKQRPLNKPGVVLVSSLEMLRRLARMTSEIETLYWHCWDQDVLLGCILPWRDSARDLIPDDGSADLVMDARGTSCFVIRFGAHAEAITRDLWDHHRRLAFASSANPSGRGNRGVITGIGERITRSADLLIEADDYVASIQPARTGQTRYEQGVMVSMVDESGHLVPEQHGERGITPVPTLIRRGLALERIQLMLSERFASWDYRHGQYY